MSLKNKIIGAVLASALATSPAFAVEGSDGMHYTSAAEGFYASIRAKYLTGGEKGDNGGFDNDSGTRFGIQGTGEMSHGLEGFYRYETGILNDNADAGATTRLSYVGLRGGFGSASFGTLWGDPYNWVGAVTDLPNVGGGNFVFGGFRKSRSIQYNSPDLNGLQVGLNVVMDGGKEADALTALPMGVNVTTIAFGDDMDQSWEEATSAPDSELDEWSLNGKYSFSGFTLGGTYLTTPDAAYVVDGNNVRVEDRSAWAISGTYGQDNWGAAAWYGQDNNSDFSYAGVSNKNDTSAFSIAGHVGIGKTKVVVMHETREMSEGDNTYDDTVTVFDVQYSLNSKAKVWAGYVARDYDSDADVEDFVNFGIRHDF